MLRVLSFLSILSFLSFGSEAQIKDLTNDQYFKGNFKGITQPLPAVTRWVAKDSFILLRDGKTFYVSAKTGQERAATDADKNQKAVKDNPVPFMKSKDIWIKYNDQDKRLTNDTVAEINATVSPDGKYVAFTRLNDLYTVDIASGKENRLTTDGSDVILNGYASWVYTEEILGRASRYRSFWWSPDSKRISFFRSDDSQVPVFTLTDANLLHGYVETVRYPKVGDKNPEIRIGLVNPAGGAVTWADFNTKDDQYFGEPIWMPDGSKLLVSWMNRKQNELKVYAVDPMTGMKQSFYEETQKTWVDLGDGFDRFKFVEGTGNIILLSDRTGWAHLYLHDMTGKEINPITSGNFTVTKIEYVDGKKKKLYFSARSKENSARSDLYTVDFSGKNLKRLSFGDFHHVIQNISPAGDYFVTSYSNATTPPRLALVSADGKINRELGSAKTAEFGNYRLAKTEVLRVKSDDGKYDLPMKITWPIDFNPAKKYPVLLSIYGGPDAGRVWDNWSLNGNQQHYAKEGLIQVQFDHRASGHFGKEGVNYMYHNLGYWEMKDYSTMIKWLIANAGADPKKICITGFSYGGYLSCYAITYGSDVFTHAMAGGSVTDWGYYDTHYTERFMGTQADNPEGYKTSSVFTYLDKYKGGLQLVHGIIDDNVHLQNSVQLASKLQDAKKDFEYMTYSGGRHGWGGNKGLHFENLKTKFIYKNLLEKEIPAGLLK